MEVNEEKRAKFMENAGKRVNKVMHDIQILEPMARSSVYDFTKEDVEEMFNAMQDALDSAKEEFNKKFEGRAKAERKMFSFGTNPVSKETEEAKQEEKSTRHFGAIKNQRECILNDALPLLALREKSVEKLVSWWDNYFVICIQRRGGLTMRLRRDK